MGGNLEQKYYNYVAKYLETEAKNEFKNSIDDSDNNFLYSYCSEVMDKVCEDVRGFENENLRNYIFNEIMLASQVGFALNSANKRFSLEAPENGTFIEEKKFVKNKISLKEKIVYFLLGLLDKE